ncbi:hypothetical protein ACGFMK_20730 [Amycolatopsis sp. NPDC049252]|uniref:hypothetical protein n=1 Tax=Amycolatopsis sp. NPDC049252 TaxID=3363933 RepID=UPI003720CEE4
MAVLWTGASMLADVNRSAGLVPGRVVATEAGEHRTADVEYTGPDGLTTTGTFEYNDKRIAPGYRVEIRVWPDGRRAEFDEGDKHTGPIVYGGLLILLGAGATAALFVWHHRVRRRG